MKNFNLNISKITLTTNIGKTIYECRSVTRNNKISGTIFVEKEEKMSSLIDAIELYLGTLTTPKQVGYTINKVVNTYGGVDFEATIK